MFKRFPQETLVKKHQEWTSNLPTNHSSLLDQTLTHPGIFVLMYKNTQACKWVGIAKNSVYEALLAIVKGVYEGVVSGSLAAWIIISHASEWDFYFITGGCSVGCINN